MVNLAEKHDEERSTQLADAEISRVLSALQKAEFKRSETGNARPSQTFKPRSLMEIAEIAKQQDEAAKSATVSAEIADLKATHAADETSNNTVDDMANGPGDAAIDDIAPENTDDDQSYEQQSAGVLDHSPQGTGLEMPLTEISGRDLQDPPATDAGVGADAGFDHGVDNESDNRDGRASQISPFETTQTAYDRGYADGSSASREADEPSFVLPLAPSLR